MKAAQPRAHLYILLFLLVWVAVSVACSNTATSENSTDGNAGSVAFSLSWDSAAAPDSGQFNAQQVTDNVCADYDIQWIHAEAVHQDGQIQSRAQWACIQRRGELTGLPPGEYTIIIQGEVSGANDWRGEATQVAVTRGQQVDAGRISMVHKHDQTAPVVVQTTPTDSARGVTLDSEMRAQFDAAIVVASIGSDNFILTQDNSSGNPIQVPCTVSYDPLNHAAVLTPAAALQADTTYTATIAVDRGLVVEDMAGNAMQQAFQWTFRTFQPDVEAPAIQSRSPDHGTMEVPLSPTVQIRFTEAIDPSTITGDSIYLEYNGTIIQGILGYDDQLNLATLRPVADLPAGATVTVVVSTDILDTTGNPLAAQSSWSFVTQYPPWRTGNIPAGGVLASSKIALEPNDTVYVGASQISDEAMIDLVRTGENTWTRSVRSSSAGSGLNFGIAIDERDYLYQAFLDFSQDLVYLALEGPRPAGGVGLAIVNQSGPVAQVRDLRLATGSDGMWSGPGVVYYDDANSMLKYAADATSWDYEIIILGAVQHPSLAMAEREVAHVAYYDPANGDLIHAERSAGGAWVAEPVDGDGVNVGTYTAIALDASGQPHISYRDETNQSLKYAARQPSGQWLVQTVDSTTTVGRDTSIAIDSLGLAHISYEDASAHALKYAARTSIGSWHTHTVDTEDDTGFGSDIIVDSLDHIHISYCFDQSMVFGSQLRYATTRPVD